MRRGALIIVAAVALATAGCGQKSAKPVSHGSPTTKQSVPPAKTAGGCVKVAVPPTRDPGDHTRPHKLLSSSTKWSLKVMTNCGEFTITLDQKSAPQAAASMVQLAMQHYFDNTIFHRIVPGFVIQAGDPTGTGQGSPGYATHDKVPKGTKYTKGVVAMAKTGAEKAGTGGSQFFVVTGADAGLPPDYAILGKVTSGQDVVDRIGRLGDPSTEKPTQAVVIKHIEVISSKG